MGQDNSTNSGKRRPCGARAFSLVELVAVITLIAILSVIAVPALSQVDRNRRVAAARQVLDDLSYARQRAAATGVRTWVVFDVPATSYQVLVENPASPGRAGATPLPDPGDFRSDTQRLATGQFVGVEFDWALFDGQAVVGFDWIGAPLSADESPLASTGVVQFEAGLQVQVEPTTGWTHLVLP